MIVYALTFVCAMFISIKRNKWDSVSRSTGSVVYTIVHYIYKYTMNRHTSLTLS